MSKHRAPTVIVLIALMQALAGCSADGKPGTGATAPSTLTPPTINAGLAVAGFINDTAFRPLADARVEVIEGPQPGVSIVSNASGQFSLAGTLFMATKAGYLPATEPIRFSAPGGRPWVIFNLQPESPAPISIGGDYTLELIADPACIDLTAEIRTRSYAATLRARSPANTQFGVDVTGPPVPFAGITIGVAGDYLAFGIYGNHNPFFIEELAPNIYLTFAGEAPGITVGSSRVSTIATSFEGSIETCRFASKPNELYDCGGSLGVTARCQAKNHRLVLTRK